LGRSPKAKNALMSDDGLLAIYLRDHFAASTAGRNRCRSARDKNRDRELGSLLDSLSREIEEDRDTLRRVMARVGIEPSRLKVAAGAALERLGRLKLNGRVTGYSPLSRVVDLEALSLGIEGKSLLWAALAQRNDQRLAEFDFKALEERAQSQRERLEPHRGAAAAALPDG
jgi:hypothetical protein